MRCPEPPLGYLPCTRKPGHDGPCAHRIDRGLRSADELEVELERERARFEGYRQALEDQNRRAVQACEELMPMLRRLLQ